MFLLLLPLPLLLLLLLLLPGMIILNAHKVTDSSGEGFAARLYRQGTGQGLNMGPLGGGGNAAGFLRAFSDSANAFAAGFNRVEKVSCGQGVLLRCTQVLEKGHGATWFEQCWWLYRVLRSCTCCCCCCSCPGCCCCVQVMKALRVRRLLLFPRFHASVKDSLESTPPEVRRKWRVFSTFFM
jgi:hypothetical protein